MDASPKKQEAVKQGSDKSRNVPLKTTLRQGRRGVDKRETKVEACYSYWGRDVRGPGWWQQGERCR